MTSIYVQDVTLRDGMHAISHNMPTEAARRIATALDTAGVAAIEVAHGDDIGTVADLRAAADLGITSVRIATHCTEADIAAQHIGTARDLGLDVAGFLMMSHMVEPDILAAGARIMESAGATCVYVTDSGGRLTMNGVRDRVRAYARCWTRPRLSASTPTTTSVLRWPTRSPPSRKAPTASTRRSPDWARAPATRRLRHLPRSPI